MANAMRSNLTVTHISHSCTQCGMCCKNRGDIFLTPLDVLQISKFFGISCEELIRKYCDRNDLEVSLKTTGADYACIFLKKPERNIFACDIYPVRPRQCYLFPLRAVGDGSFAIGLAPYCAENDELTPVMDFVNRNSNSRYDKETALMKRFIEVLNRLDTMNLTQQQKEEIFKFLFYNRAEYEINKKIISLL